MNLLFNGCSFTADCGFTKDNQGKYHWPHLVSQHFSAMFNNIAIGGSSNDEIFYRQILQSHNTSYDAVIIMWTGLNRRWIFQSDHNVDDFTSITPDQIYGFNCDQSYVADYSKLHYAYFSNTYINLRNWLTQLITLSEFLIAKKQPYVYIRGMHNYLRELELINYDSTQGFIGMPKWCKQMLDFDNRSDEYICAKLTQLQSLIKTVKSYNWLDWDDLSFFDQRKDLADDLLHPGIISNKQVAEKVVTYMEAHCQLSAN